MGPLKAYKIGKYCCLAVTVWINEWSCVPVVSVDEEGDSIGKLKVSLEAAKALTGIYREFHREKEPENEGQTTEEEEDEEEEREEKKKKPQIHVDDYDEDSDFF